MYAVFVNGIQIMNTSLWINRPGNRHELYGLFLYQFLFAVLSKGVLLLRNSSSGFITVVYIKIISTNV